MATAGEEELVWLDGPVALLVAREAVTALLLAGMVVLAGEAVALWWRALARVPGDLARRTGAVLARLARRG